MTKIDWEKWSDWEKGGFKDGTIGPIDLGLNNKPEPKLLSDEKLTQKLNLLQGQTGIVVLVDPNAPTIPVVRLENGEETQPNLMTIYNESRILTGHPELQVKRSKDVPHWFSGGVVQEATVAGQVADWFDRIGKMSGFFDENTNIIVREEFHNVLEDLSIRFVELSQEVDQRRIMNAQKRFGNK